ncbi:glyceraldehyde-3-phosphate dehydrogenase [Pseudoclavibacter chungangensis]|uniref:Glyceraldehyde-3-phosphate dehydrogenase n=1 Tax=Pseudoclavibacter chungangensis TaxID=587635 RepID=A0A7J5BQF3_9MICO|nr:glyceraldehyde-3-phosphate dehydrogenase [Pseudoclavibacter chungangensis]KAB1653271.1 glyceraldehyde-3-phosphate dehydrogenase [Pseudoclavibacter chungangensis]NYJ66958.1 glyceraldehyde 3-phosphate dehydrogenase [Pseudoclavibacter chungangensis]
MPEQFREAQGQWLDRVAVAESMIPLIGKLYREHNVVTSIHGHRLINLSAIEIIKAHRYARRVNDIELDLATTLPILEHLAGLELGTASVDLGQLATRYDAQGGDLDTFLRAELAEVLGTQNGDSGADVVLYGFGRIGRLLARILIGHAGSGLGLRLRAIVVRRNGEGDLAKRASLLKRDSVHGPFAGTISVDTENNTILANGTLIQVIYSDDPATIDYTAYGIDDAIVVDNTGRWRDEEGLSQHLRSKGVARVLLTAPGKGSLRNVVHGINHEDITEADRIISAASCTTNAITPVLKALDDRFGIEHGHVETVHSFTNDQNLIDNFHRGDRRGRAATLNMVITETGAAKAVAKALPSFAGKLTGNSIRVPTPDVSMAVLNLTMATDVDRETVNDYLRQVALNSNLRQQIDYVESGEVVSSDFIGTTRAGIVDGLATIASGRNLVVYVWYDNEFGYSSQVIRIVEYLGGVHPPVVPSRRELDQLGI